MSASQDEVFLFSFTGVLGVLITFTVCIFVIALVIHKGQHDITPGQAERISERTAPIGQVNTDPNAAVNMASAQDSDEPRSGQQVVEAVCSGCHAAGIMNAPKIGDTQAWNSRGDLAKLVQSSMAGFGTAMPAKGGDPSLTEDEARAAIEFMMK